MKCDNCNRKIMRKSKIKWNPEIYHKMLVSLFAQPKFDYQFAQEYVPLRPDEILSIKTHTCAGE